MTFSYLSSVKASLCTLGSLSTDFYLHHQTMPLLNYFNTPLLQVAMGQGQSDIALRLLRDCASNGDWLCLKNLHLMIHWLSVLEKVRLKGL